MNRYYQIGISFLLILIVGACGTKTKKKGDAPWLKRNYHSLTTKYNYYYNANVLLQDGIAKLNAANQDNYNQILEMFPYSAVENVDIVKGDMDNAIKKMSTAAAIHRFGDWVDDCALLMAKAQYLKKDYEGAEETLAYLTEEFKPTRNKKAAAKEKKEIAEDKKKATKQKQEDKKKAAAKKKKEQEKKRKEAAKAKEKARKDKAKGKKTISLDEQEKAADNAAKQSIKNSGKEDEDEKKEKEEDRLEIEPKDIDKAKPKRYFLKRRPVYQEAMAWLARTYTERKKFEEANDILVTLLKNRSTFRDVRRMAAQYYAYNFLKQKEYTKSIKPLERAIKLTKNKKEKARFYFILGQIQEKLGHDAEALNAYDKVLSYKSIPYDMEFSARMNVALFAYTKGQGSSDDAIKSLTKMTKEAKNSDYLDQIYFALAQIALKNNDKKLAVEHLRKSLVYSKKNANQKAEAYLLMASLLYDSENYLPAKNYYDSTIMVLPKTDERYDEAKRLAFGLTGIAKNIKIIQIQDSLLRIAEMSPEQQKAFCLRLKQRDIEAEEKAEAAIKLASENSGKTNSDLAITYGPGITPSTFFAYNFKSLSQGKRSFEQKWGKDRKLEDNWRRKNKKSENTDTPLADNGTEKDKEVKRDKSKITDDEFRKMMANVPQNEMQKEAANNEVANAMLALGKAYRESLRRNDKCINTLEELLRRYPTTPNELEALYQLYNAYSDSGKTAKAKECYDKILSKYPNTTYARVLSDPDYAKKTRREGQDLEDYYKLTFEAFNKGQFKTAYERSTKADSLFKKNPIKPKFALIAAMSAGNLFGKERYIGAIKEVIAKFPETTEQKRAKEILRLLDGGEGAYQDALGGGNVDSGPYKRDDDVSHYVVVVLTDKNSKIEDAKSNVADFNKDNYKSKNLKISNVFFGAASDIPMLVIRKFEDRAEAMKYYYHVEEVRDAFMPGKTPFDVFAISQNNYKELLKDKSTEVYKAFFEYAYKGN